MIADTSTESFHAAKSSGLISRQEKVILDSIPFTGRYSRRQIEKLSGISISSVGPRVLSLIAKGKLVEDTEPVACPITGKRVYHVMRVF